MVNTAHIDLRTREKFPYLVRGVRCGVCCDNCGWRGMRKEYFALDMNRGRPEPFPTAKANAAIKGTISYLPCPKCKAEGWKAKGFPKFYKLAGLSVVYTHVPQANKRTWNH
jgi:hypothetical protein